MKIDNIDVTKTIEKIQNLLAKEAHVSPILKSLVELLILIITILISKLSLNSKNSSKPPASDPNRKKDPKKDGKKKTGGQNGHVGNCLESVANPDEIKKIKVDTKLLPKEGKYTETGYEARQVVNIQIKKIVTEYRAQILTDQDGKIYKASFPDWLTQKIQYGESIKSHSVYMSQFQLIPYGRVQDYFSDQMKIPLSEGSIFNFNKEAYNRLEEFDKIAKEKLINSERLNVDETGINVNGKKMWLHNASNNSWVYFYPHKARGTEAMDEIGILANFKGVMTHDHWKPYYTYTTCIHSLCNAHHLRELQKVIEDHKLEWAEKMQDLLLAINEEVEKAGCVLSDDRAKIRRDEYREILTQGIVESVCRSA